VFQTFPLLAAGIMNGFLLAWIHVKDIGLKQNIVVLELMVRPPVLLLPPWRDLIEILSRLP